MTDPVRVLYLVADRSTADAVESHLGDERPDVDLSTAAGVDSALAECDGDGEGVDCVVVDPSLAGDGEPAARLRDRLAVPVETVPTPPDASGTERARVVAGRIAEIAATEVDGESDRPPESETYFRALAKAVSDAILVIDADSTVRFANPFVEDIFGYAPEELVGESLTLLMPERFRERHRKALARYLREGERRLDWEYVELPGRHRDGRELTLGVSFSEFVRDGELRFAGVLRDVTEQVRQSEELEDRVRQQRAVASFSQSALADRPLADLFDQAVELVADTLDHDYCRVLELVPDHDELVVRATAGRGDDTGTDPVGAERDSHAGYTLRSEESVVVDDFATEDRFSAKAPADHDAASGVSAVIGESGEPWGVLSAHHTDRRPYADHDVQFVESVARILTAAIRRRERERVLERYEAMLEAVDDGVYALDADARFVGVNDAYCSMTGYDREELLGRPASKVTDEELVEEVDEMQRRLEDGASVTMMETTLPTADGGSIPVEARVSLFPLDGGEYGRVGVLRDVSERRRREEKLTSLHATMQSLAEADATDDVCELAADAAVETLGFENAVVALYDGEAGTLASATARWTADAPVDDVLVGRHAEDVAWEAFVSSETRNFADIREEYPDATMASALAVPLGRHGVLIAADPEPAAFDETDASLADILGADVTSSLDRVAREETLRDQRNDLREKNLELERVNRLNGVIRKITRVLTDASTREEVLRSLCRSLTETGPYRFAWFGEYDRATDRVIPAAQAGAGEGYLEEVTVTASESDPRGKGPTGRAIRTRESQVQDDVFGDPPFEPWREAALKRGYRSTASIPVEYAGTLYGVVNVYADDPGVFDETERAVLEELGETTGYALNALERKQALVSDRSIDLDFRIRDADYPLLAAVGDADAEFEFETVVQRADGRLHLFFTVLGIPPEQTLAYADELSEIEATRLVTDRDEEYLYEGVLTDESFLKKLVHRGAIPQSMTAVDGESRVVIRVPQSADVRAFVELFDDTFEAVELVARRERDESVMTRREFESELERRLTERQREVLELAYFSGFFEWPRESTAEDIAEVLDVSQPTVSRHLRGAERRLFSLLFEDD